MFGLTGLGVDFQWLVVALNELDLAVARQRPPLRNVPLVRSRAPAGVRGRRPPTGGQGRHRALAFPRAGLGGVRGRRSPERFHAPDEPASVGVSTRRRRSQSRSRRRRPRPALPRCFHAPARLVFEVDAPTKWTRSPADGLPACGRPFPRAVARPSWRLSLRDRPNSAAGGPCFHAPAWAAFEVDAPRLVGEAPGTTYRPAAAPSLALSRAPPGGCPYAIAPIQPPRRRSHSPTPARNDTTPAGYAPPGPLAPALMAD
jgi:hypothetical protein